LLFLLFYIVTAVAVAVIPTYWSNLKKEKKVHFFCQATPKPANLQTHKTFFFYFSSVPIQHHHLLTQLNSSPCLRSFNFLGGFGYSTIANCKLE